MNLNLIYHVQCYEVVQLGMLNTFALNTATVHTIKGALKQKSNCLPFFFNS